MPNFNAFMHRRNIFRKEPDFKKLACEYQELKQFMTSSSKNKLKFDFKNPDALRALTCALLHRYFQKRITIPSDRLIPAVPQRLNYICWIEDLVKLLALNLASSDLNVLGIDIGTGASCIFPILSCHKNPGWSFIGVEADQKSYSVAMENVQKNFMDDRIRIVKISTEDTLNDILCLANSPATFIMCNPPFFEEEYGVTLELNPNICGANGACGNVGCGDPVSGTCTGGGRPKSHSNTSDRIESICSGGEIAFVGRLLDQSRHLKEEVTIYSSMLGRKQSLTHFKQTLSSLNEDNLSWTWAELCQGKTIRYAVAWSFYPGFDLSLAPPLRHGKNKSWKVKLQRKMPKRDCQLEMLENTTFLKNLIARELMIAKARVSRQSAQNFEMLIKTNERTWTHQRRKRREQQSNKHKHQATPSSVNFNTTTTSTTTAAKLSSGTANQQQEQSMENSISQQMVCDNTEPMTDTWQAKTSTLQMSASNFDGTPRGGDTAATTTSVGMDLDLATDMDNQQVLPTNPTLVSSTSFSSFSSSQLNKFTLDQQNNIEISASTSATSTTAMLNGQHASSNLYMGLNNALANYNLNNMKKRKNLSSCSSSPSRVCPSPNDELTDDDNQSSDNSDNIDTQNEEDSMNESSMFDVKRICKDNGDNDCENFDDIYDYLLCCRISLSRVCHDLYFELKLEHPCTAANDAYDLFQYFRNKLAEK